MSLANVPATCPRNVPEIAVRVPGTGGGVPLRGHTPPSMSRDAVFVPRKNVPGIHVEQIQ